MEDEKIENLMIELKMTLYNDLKNFWLNNKELPLSKLIYISFNALTYLISYQSYILFSKDKDNQEVYKYIDEICMIAKKQFDHHQECIEKDSIQ